MFDSILEPPECNLTYFCGCDRAVVECSPSIPTMDSLLQEVNSTNDFSKIYSDGAERISEASKDRQVTGYGSSDIASPMACRGTFTD